MGTELFRGSLADHGGSSICFRLGDRLHEYVRAGTADSLVDGIIGAPAWSPDGTRIAFVASRAEDYQEALDRYRPTDSVYRGDVPVGATLYSINADDSDLRVVADVPVPHVDRLHLEWSRDSASILVSNSHAVFLVGADGSGVRASIEGTYGSWSPDNSRIAVLLVRLPRRGETVVLFTTEPDGTDRRVLVRYRDERLVAESPSPKRPWYRLW